MNIVVIGGAQMGKSSLLKYINKNQDKIIYQSIPTDIEVPINVKKDNSDDYLDSIVYARDILNKESFPTPADEMQNLLNEINHNYVAKKNKEIADKFGVTEEQLNSFCRELNKRAVSAKEASELLKNALKVMATPQMLSDLFPAPKPQKIKFHNNLRSKLNTGGIKWIK